MGKHTEWRKLVKKIRRKRIRQALALSRDAREKEEQQEREKLPHYSKWLDEQKRIEEFETQEEAKISAEKEAEWKRTEEIAQVQWTELQLKLAVIREERAKQNEKIKLEWEREEKKLKALKEQKEKEAEEKKRREEYFKEQINEFVAHGGMTPEHLKVQFQSNPNKSICPFFQKTSACRFGDSCSRNHIRPGVSRIILVPNFYSHYSLNKSENEHGDSSLECENQELYDHFREFFEDVVPEMEKCGKVRTFKVCCNSESHLRGNVYIEYSLTREAVCSYQLFNGRWYGGKQLNVEFCGIKSWKSAICGLHFKKRCPKGSSCNFLHVFYNPENVYDAYEQETRNSPKYNTSRHGSRSDRKDWRWSESPEKDMSNTRSEWDEDCHLGARRTNKYSSGSRRKRESSSNSHRRSTDSRSSRSGTNKRRRENQSDLGRTFKSRPESETVIDCKDGYEGKQSLSKRKRSSSKFRNKSENSGVENGKISRSRSRDRSGSSTHDKS